MTSFLITDCRAKRRSPLKRPRMAFKPSRTAAVTQTRVIARGLLLFNRRRSLMPRGKRRFSAANSK